MTPKTKKTIPRIKTRETGVYYREVQRVGGNGTERMYYITYKKDGKTFEEKVGRQYADAMTVAKARDFRSDRIRNKVPSRKEIREEERTKKEHEINKLTIDRLCEEYLREKGEYSSRKDDISRYAKHIKPVFGSKEPHEIIKLDLERFKNKLKKKLAPQTTKHVLILFFKIVNYGSDNNRCEGFPFKVKMPPVNNIVTEDLTPKQLERLLTAIEEDINRDVGNIMKFALFTGMRKTEILKLMWDDVDFERGFITIRTPKSGKDEKIPLNDGAREVLESQPRTESPYVFPGKDGGQRTNVSTAVNRIKKRAKLPEDFRPLHGLRHAYASMLASSGEVDMYTLQKLMTHKSPVMTQRYAHLRDEALKKGADVASNIINTAINGESK